KLVHYESSTYPTTHTLTFSFSHATAPTEIYTLSLHDALPISSINFGAAGAAVGLLRVAEVRSDPALLALAEIWKSRAARDIGDQDRKSTRLNSSHVAISYAVFCLKKKK